MALVPISMALLSDVEHNLQELRHKEFHAAPQAKDLIDALPKNGEFVRVVRDVMWTPFAEVRHLIDRPPMAQPLTVYVTITLQRDTKVADDGTPATTQCSVPVQVPDAPAFARSIGWDGGTARTNLCVADLPHLLEPIRQRTDALEEITERWSKVQSQVLSFLDNCKSLNEAVKLWPDVLRYVPDEYKERLERKAVKVVKESAALAALKEIDLDAVTTSTVLARMAGAKV